MEQSDTKSLQNGSNTEVPYTKTPRFLGPPIKVGEIVNGNGVTFLPLGAGGPAPPIFETCQMKIDTPVYERTSDLEPDTPHVRFLGESPNLTEENNSSLPPEEIQEIINGLEKCKITEKIDDTMIKAGELETGENKESVTNEPKLQEMSPPGPPNYTEERMTSQSSDMTSSTEVIMTQTEDKMTSPEIPEEKSTEVTAKITEEKSTEVTAKITEVPEVNTAVEPAENINPPPVMKIFECFVGMEGADKKFGIVPHALDAPVINDHQSVEHQTCVLKSLPPISVDKTPEQNSGSTPPNTPLVENTEVSSKDVIDDMFRGDPARIPLGAGGPGPSICHPLSRDGIPAQSPPHFPVPAQTDLTTKSSEEKCSEDEGVELRDKSSDVAATTKTRDQVKSLPPEVAKKPARGAIARLASSSGEEKPMTGLSIAAPRRSHSFIGFSSPSLASSVAGSVHAHRQQFLQRRMLFEQPQEVKKPTLRKFEIELKALKLGKKSLCDSWVTEEKEDIKSPTSRTFQRTSFRASFIHRKSTEKIPEDEGKKEEST